MFLGLPGLSLQVAQVRPDGDDRRPPGLVRLESRLRRGRGSARLAGWPAWRRRPPAAAIRAAGSSGAGRRGLRGASRPCARRSACSRPRSRPSLIIRAACSRIALLVSVRPSLNFASFLSTIFASDGTCSIRRANVGSSRSGRSGPRVSDLCAGARPRFSGRSTVLVVAPPRRWSGAVARAAAAVGLAAAGLEVPAVARPLCRFRSGPAPAPGVAGAGGERHQQRGEQRRAPRPLHPCHDVRHGARHRPSAAPSPCQARPANLPPVKASIVAVISSRRSCS